MITPGPLDVVGDLLSPRTVAQTGHDHPLHLPGQGIARFQLHGRVAPTSGPRDIRPDRSAARPAASPCAGRHPSCSSPTGPPDPNPCAPACGSRPRRCPGRLWCGGSPPPSARSWPAAARFPGSSGVRPAAIGQGLDPVAGPADFRDRSSQTSAWCAPRPAVVRFQGQEILEPQGISVEAEIPPRPGPGILQVRIRHSRQAQGQQ